MTDLLTLREADTCDLVCRGLTVRAESINEEERSVEAVLTTNTRATVFDFGSLRMIDEILDPEGAEYGRQVVLLDSHQRYDTSSVLGSIRNMRRDGDGTVGRLYFAKDNERAEAAWNLVRQGHLTDVSIGYRANDFVDIPARQTQVVNGRSYTAGDRTLRITKRFSIREGSLVPIGADAAAKIRSEHQSTHSRNITMPVALRRYLESIGLRKEATEDEANTFRAALSGEHKLTADWHSLSPEQQTAFNASRTATPAPVMTPPVASQPANLVDTDAIRREAATAERARMAMCRSAQVEGVSDELVERAINEGWDATRVNQEYLTALRSHREQRQTIEGAPAVHTRTESTDNQLRGLAAGLMHRTSTQIVLDGPNATRFGWSRHNLVERDADLGDRYREFSLYDMCREFCQLTGVRDPLTGDVPWHRSEFIRAAVSTPTFSNIYTTSVHARLLMGYMGGPDTSDWCSTEDVSNFQTQDRIATGQYSNLKLLPSGGTADHATVSDNIESYKIARYARQFVMDEQDILSDNLDAIQNTPVAFGAAAGRLRPDLVYSILLANANMRDAVALFHSTHSNTATNAFSSTNMATGVAAMYAQSEDGVRLNLRPRWLIVNPSLEGSGRATINSELLLTGSDTTIGNQNWLRQLNMEIRVESRLDATGVTNPANNTAYTGSTTTWFLVADNMRTVRVGYLAGTNRQPVIRRAPLTQGQWGVGWDVNMDIGAKALDWRGMYRGNT